MSNRTMAPARTYQSPLREAQAALTRQHILMAAKGYLEKHDIETLTLRHVAELSGVSPPTVYAHFPTMEALVSAFFQWVMYGRRPRCKRNLTISEAFGCGHVFGL
jgi:AcrR family transcriptional regulator